MFHNSIYCDHSMDTARIEYKPTCIVCITCDIVIDCVRKACILCAIVSNCVESYMVSYGDLVSIIYLIPYNTTLRNTINNKNNQPYHIV